ncbi:MAG TPA: hemerythrin domain-containing protein [Mycobacteriales bacterium]|nr:hemerythrin domain-containing protein [Mycobacteriales bacterium]
MVTQEQVRRLVEGGASYDAAAARLGIDPGLAYLIATGLPADGGDTLTSADRDRPGFRAGSTQHLANPRTPENPTRNESVLSWIKQRAHTDAPLLAAAAERDAEPGEVQDPEDDEDVTTVLTRDHDRVTALLEQLSAIPGHKQGGSAAQIERRESIVDMITVELSKHESVEQEHLWPAVREALPDGPERAEQAMRQEQEGKDTLTALGKADPDSDEFDELVELLVLLARKHVAFEDQVFLALDQAMDDEQRQRLGAKLRRSKVMAPTRPHPHAPKQPGSAVLAAGAPAALVDKARDAVGRRPAKRKGKASGEAAGKQREAEAAQATPAAQAPSKGQPPPAPATDPATSQRAKNASAEAMPTTASPAKAVPPKGTPRKAAPAKQVPGKAAGAKAGQAKKAAGTPTPARGKGKHSSRKGDRS